MKRASTARTFLKMSSFKWPSSWKKRGNWGLLSLTGAVRFSAWGNLSWMLTMLWWLVLRRPWANLKISTGQCFAWRRGSPPSRSNSRTKSKRGSNLIKCARPSIQTTSGEFSVSRKNKTLLCSSHLSMNNSWTKSTSGSYSETASNC